MQILIVGAGIGGLSAYLSLKKHLEPYLPPNSLSIRIVEAYTNLSGDSSPGAPLTSASTIVGAGLGLAPNGLRAIHSLSPSAAQYILDRGFVDDASKFTFRNSDGKTLGVLSVGSKRRYGGFGMVMVSRAVVFEALMRAFRDKRESGKEGEEEEGLKNSKFVEWGRKVVGVTELPGGGVQVLYADGVTEVVDLVIGADGVRSRVRESLFEGKYSAEYEGMIGVGGFLPVSLLPQSLQQAFLHEGDNERPEEGIVMTFGTKGAFGYSLITPRSVPNTHVHHGPIIQWWGTYETPQPTFSSARAKTTEEANAVKQSLLEMYGSWKSPNDGRDESESEQVFRSLIELGCVSEEVADNLEYHHTPVLLLPRYVVPRWLESYSTPSKSGRIILLGDAAHAMPPDAGQGVSCAVEDAVVYSLLLAKFLAHHSAATTENKTETTVVPDGAISQAAAAYDELRMPRVGKILDIAKYRGDSKREMGIVGGWIRDLAIWIYCLLPESWHDETFAYEPEKVVEEYFKKDM